MDRPGDVRLTWVRRDRLPGDLAAEVARATLLDLDEQGRAAAYRRVEDRGRFVLGATLLHRELARASGTDPATPVVDRTCPRCGRPHGAPRPLAAGWSASVTHSADVVAVAVRYGGEVGIDVERLPTGASVDRATMSSVLSAAELRWVAAGRGEPDDDDEQARFVRLWTGKEAVLKAIGRGVDDLARVELDPEDRCRVVRLPAGAARPVHLDHHRLDASYHVAVALVAPTSGAVVVSQARCSPVTGRSSRYDATPGPREPSPTRRGAVTGQTRP